MNNKFCFCLWYGPQYNFAYGIATKQQLQVIWLEKLDLCDLKYTNIEAMFRDVANKQGWNRVEGLAMTIISEELLSEEIRIEHKNLQAKRQREI